MPCRQVVHDLTMRSRCLQSTISTGSLLECHTLPLVGSGAAFLTLNSVLRAHESPRHSRVSCQQEIMRDFGESSHEESACCGWHVFAPEWV